MKQRFWILALLAGSAAAHADAVLEYSGGDAACHGEFTRLAVEGLSLRVDSPPPQQDMSFVYDAAEKAGVALDHRRKQFFEIEFDDDAIDFQGDVMKSTSHMVDKKIQQVQAQLPPAIRAGIPYDSTEYIRNAIDELERISQQILYPNMKADWVTYPDNLSHQLPEGIKLAAGQDNPGCFRCHGTLVKSTTQELLPGTMGGNSCLACHGSGDASNMQISAADPTTSGPTNNRLMAATTKMSIISS